MKLVLLVAAVSLLAAGEACAGGGASFVDGDWVGTGSFQMGDRLLACSEVKMKFGGSETSFVVGEASLVCGNDPKQEFTATGTFTIKEDGQIYFEHGTDTKRQKGLRAGSVKDNLLHIFSPVDGGGINDISMRRAGDLLIYDETAGNPGETPAYSLMAIMKKAHP